MRMTSSRKKWLPLTAVIIWFWLLGMRQDGYPCRKGGSCPLVWCVTGWHALPDLSLTGRPEVCAQNTRKASVFRRNEPVCRKRTPLLFALPLWQQRGGTWYHRHWRAGIFVYYGFYFRLEKVPMPAMAIIVFLPMPSSCSTLDIWLPTDVLRSSWCTPTCSARLIIRRCSSWCPLITRWRTLPDSYWYCFSKVDTPVSRLSTWMTASSSSSLQENTNNTRKKGTWLTSMTCLFWPISTLHSIRTGWRNIPGFRLTRFRISPLSVRNHRPVYWPF